MLQRITFLSSLSLFLIALFWILFFVRVRQSDLDVCRHLHEQHRKASREGILSSASQQRKGVVKEIFFIQEDRSRLHYRIFSDVSLLTLQPNGKKIHLIEKLEKITCWMQDKLYDTSNGASPMQQVRLLKAEEGLYYYATQQFSAQTVALALHRLPGHELPKETRLSTPPFLKGIAQDVSFAVSGKTPHFQAREFRAELQHIASERS